jgi:hypothetical protein
VSIASVAGNSSGRLPVNPRDAAGQLEQNLRNRPGSRQPTVSKPPVSSQNIQNDIGELRQALGSGDLSNAFRAYTRLQTDLRTVEEPNAREGDAPGNAAAQGSPEPAAEKKTVLYA